MRRFLASVFLLVIVLSGFVCSKTSYNVNYCNITNINGFSLDNAFGSRVDEIVNEEEKQRRRVYLGGQAVGFSLDIDGVLVTSIDTVDTCAGRAKLKSELKVGDIILGIDGKRVDNEEDIIREINRGKTSYDFEITRSGEILRFIVSPLIDRISGENRLGIGISTELDGIGTVSYITQNGDFGALGHAVGTRGECVKVSGGDVCGCKILGIQKGKKGRAGAIKGTLIKREHKGTVYANTNCGIFGRIACEGILYDTARRDEVVCGRAKICSEINGKREFYDIEIVKTSYQNGSEEKGMVIKITDKRLIALTGGIVQGMSGSPIVQNDKIVGAVTHVFINDPTRGYGVYYENMRQKMKEVI